MAVHRFALSLLVLALFAAGTAALADDASAQDRPLLRRLDNFGKSIFGGATGDDAEKEKEKNTKETTVKSGARAAISAPTAVQDSQDEKDWPRSNTGPSKNAQTAQSSNPSESRLKVGNSSRPPAAITASQVDSPRRRDENMPPATGGEGKAAKSTSRPLAQVLAGDSSGTAVGAARKTPAAVSQATDSLESGVSQNDETPTSSEDIAAPSKSNSRPLHSRLSGFRQSAFPMTERHDPEPQADIRADFAPEVQPIHVSETPADEQLKSLGVAPQPRTAASPTVARRNVVAERPHGEGAAEPSRESTVEALPNAEAKPELGGSLLVARKSAILSVETLGPRKIAVGKESTFEVSIVNSGEVAAEDLVVYVSLPAWADVSATEPTVGNAQVAPIGDGGVVQWRVGRLDSKARERIMLRIIPRQSKPFDLAVRWEHKPNGSQAMIEVQEPKLELQLEGPREVLYGKQETYRLKIANNGTGNAENVTIMLMPLGEGENVAATYKVGMLGAGQERALDVELTARQAGNLTIQLDATADGNVHVELAEKVLVRRAGLQADVEGPKIQFVGQQTTYTIRVRNPGTATANTIAFAAVLPMGAKYVSGIENAAIDATGGKLTWCLEKLDPNAEQSYTICCKHGVPGPCRMEIIATAEDDLSTAAVASTRVDSVASLVMEVKDPMEPVAVGNDAAYEVRLRNRGSKEAENVEVFVYFSRGIEPIAAEGAPNRLLPGQVIFMPIPSIGPGAEVTLKLRGRADVAGNHVFRVEAHCKPLGARLVREATNLFFTDGPNAQQVAKENPSEAARTTSAALDTPSDPAHTNATPDTPPPANHASQAAAASAEPRK